jgi:hypothetical protein
MHLKFIHFFSISFFFSIQLAHSQPSREKIILADKYFEQKDYKNAKAIYYNLIREKSNIEKNALLKLAYIHEKEQDFTKTLYFLNLYYERNPTERVISKMNSIAIENNLKGYELSDFYLIQLLIKQYSFVINLILAFLALYVTVILFTKKRKNQPISIFQKFVLFLYLLIVFCIFNISKIYKQGIVHIPNTSIRIDPSSASPVYDVLPQGQRINILGSEDIWWRVIRGNKFYYINKVNIWLVN